MATLRIASFNCENLFMRYKFNSRTADRKKSEAVHNGFIIDPGMFERFTEAEKSVTAEAIRLTRADIVALIEVENMDTLKNFCSQYLKDYKYRALIDGNDPRLIDVSVISKIPFDNLVTHQTMRLKNGRYPVFSRDCLEVNFTIRKKPLTLFINHFKSMMDKNAKTPSESRANTAQKRRNQTKAVLQIIQNKFGSRAGRYDWIVLGDLNDYNDSKSSLKELLNSGLCVNILEKELSPDNWTHFWDTTRVPVSQRYKQIDYLLPSVRLSTRMMGKPEIIRNGLVTKATLYKGSRIKGVTDKTGASDHCPVVATFNF